MSPTWKSFRFVSFLERSLWPGSKVGIWKIVELRRSPFPLLDQEGSSRESGVVLVSPGEI